VYYDLIWARKAGSRSRLGRGTSGKTDILRCPRCTHFPMIDEGDTLLCSACGHRYPIQGSIHLLSS
jgi:hypothetical protein